MGKAVSDLPDGFVLDGPSSADLPAGFELDEPKAKKQSGPKLPAILASYFAGPMEAAAHLGSSVLAGPASGLAGLGAAGLNTMGAKLDPASVVENVGSAMTYEPRTEVGKATSDLIDTPFRKLAEVGEAAGQGIASAGDPNRPLQMRIPGRGPVSAKEYGNEGSPLMGAAVDTAIQSIPAFLLKGRGRPAEVAGDVSRPSGLGASVDSVPGTPPRTPAAAAKRPAGLGRVSEAAPTKEALGEAATAAYKRADESGVVVTPESFGALKSKITDQMERDGIDPTLHPDSTAALKRITDSDGSLSLQKLETLRRVASDAEGSIKPADQRLAGKMVDEIDDYIDSLTESDVVAGDATKAKALKEARGLYSRKMKAEELDRLVERAKLSAPNFSGSGMENALRTEFRSLAKNERKMRRFTKEEQEAIKQVAKGGTTENIMRMFGKFAPTGAVSSIISGTIGAAIGGPAGAALVPAAGLGARYAATRLTMRNADRANEIVRRGPMPAQIEAAQRSGILTPEQAKFLNQ